MKPATLHEAMVELHKSALDHGWRQLAEMYLAAATREAEGRLRDAWENYQRSAEAFARKLKRPKEPS